MLTEILLPEDVPPNSPPHLPHDYHHPPRATNYLYRCISPPLIMCASSHASSVATRTAVVIRSFSSDHPTEISQLDWMFSWRITWLFPLSAQGELDVSGLLTVKLVSSSCSSMAARFWIAPQSPWCGSVSSNLQQLKKYYRSHINASITALREVVWFFSSKKDFEKKK